MGCPLTVYVILDRVLALVQAHAFQLSDGQDLFILQAKVFDEVFFKCVPVQVCQGMTNSHLLNLPEVPR